MSKPADIVLGARTRSVGVTNTLLAADNGEIDPGKRSDSAHPEFVI